MTDGKKIYFNGSMDFDGENLHEFQAQINGEGSELILLFCLLMGNDEGLYEILRDAVAFFEENKGDILTMLVRGGGKAKTTGIRIDSRKKE